MHQDLSAPCNNISQPRRAAQRTPRRRARRWHHGVAPSTHRTQPVSATATPTCRGSNPHHQWDAHWDPRGQRQRQRHPARDAVSEWERGGHTDPQWERSSHPNPQWERGTVDESQRDAGGESEQDAAASCDLILAGGSRIEGSRMRAPGPRSKAALANLYSNAAHTLPTHTHTHTTPIPRVCTPPQPFAHICVATSKF